MVTGSVHWSMQMAHSKPEAVSSAMWKTEEARGKVRRRN